MPFPEAEWGVPLVIGVSEGELEMPKPYYEINHVRLDHDRYRWVENEDGSQTRGQRIGSSPLSRTCESMFNQGVRKLWAMNPICSEARTLSVTDLLNMEHIIEGLVTAGRIDSLVLSNITCEDTDMMIALRGIAERCGVVTAITNPTGMSAPDILRQFSNCKSANIYAIAHGDRTIQHFIQRRLGRGEFLGEVPANGILRIATLAEYPVLYNANSDFELSVYRDGEEEPYHLNVELHRDYILYSDVGVIVFDNAERRDWMGDGVDTRPEVSNSPFIFRPGDQLYAKYTAIYDYDDIAACALGAILIKAPWITAMWKPVNCAINEYFRPDEVQMLERGDPLIPGTGNVNCIINPAGANILSDGLTCGGNPRYLDIIRTRYYLVRRVKEALWSLRQNTDKLGFDATGFAAINGALEGVMEDMVRANAITNYQVSLPNISGVPYNDRMNRVLRNIKIGARLVGDIHQFYVDLSLTV
jgi:hypothetical protein